MTFKIGVFICICLLKTALCLERGDPCTSNGEKGVCKEIDDCPAAVKLLTIDYKKPPMCRWENLTRIVCCSVEDKSHTVGVFRNIFVATKDGVLRSPDMLCRYKGSVPMTCCQNRPVLQPPEPEECPAVPKPSLSRTDIAWKKCLEYQRYVHVCVSSDNDPNEYEREDTCDMETSSNRITGGIPSKRREFPHMALLGCRNQIDDTSYIKWVGGGALISEKYILTAAHVTSHPQYGLVVYALLGATNKSEVRDGVMYNVIRHEPYRLYQKAGTKHDIALLELDKNVQFSEFIRPVCLPMPGLPLSSERIVAGWGRTNEFDSDSQLLLKTVLKEIDYKTECQPFLGVDEQNLDPATIICAEGRKNDTCQGDSGGPLLAYTDALYCTYVTRGIVSWGQRCGTGAPAVYTNVEYYMKWIVDTVWPNEQ